MVAKDLSRGFGFWTGWYVVVASMIGSGILTNSGFILQKTGSSSALIFLWALGGVLAVFGALTLAEMASGLPHVGGDYVYVREAFGPAWGFTYGLAMVVVGFAAPTALISYTSANFLLPLLKPFMASICVVSDGVCVQGFASLLVVMFTISHCLGHTSSATIQSLTTLFKVLTLIALAALCAFSPGVNWQLPLSGVGIGEVNATSLGSSLIMVMYAYTGWNAASYLAGETREAEKHVPRCLVAGCAFVAVVYVLINWVYVHVLSVEEVSLLGEVQLNRFAEVVADKALGSHMAKTFATLISLGTMASVSAYLLTGPRIVFAMAKDGLIPRHGALVHSKTGVPVVATVFQGVLSILFLWSGTFEQVLNYTGFGLACIGIFVVVPLFILRKREGFRPPFKTPGYPWTTGIFVVASVAMLAAGAVDDPWVALLSAASVLVGWPIYFLISKK